ncbi:MAG: DUF885 domain-containing protein [Flavobacteriaceae bacterium]
MKHRYLFLLLATVLACSNPKTAADFDAYLETAYQENLALYRLPSTYLGESRYNDTLPNYLSAEFAAKEIALNEKYKAGLAEFPDAILSEDQRLSKQLMLWEIDLALAEKSFLKSLMPIDQMWSFHLSFGQLASGQGAQPFVSPQDYRNWLVRVEGYLAWMQSAEAKMREGMEKEWVLPVSLIDKVLPQLAQMITERAEDHLFYGPITMLPATFSEAEKEEFTTAYTTLINDKVVPAYRQLHDFMAQIYRPAGRTSSGYGALAGGANYYQHAIKRYTTTNMTPEEIHQLGLSEVKRIRTAMEEVKASVGFKGDLMAFFDHVRTKKELMPFNDPQQVIDNFNAIHQKVMPKVDQLFSLQPKTAFEVRRTEAFREASASAEYNSGSLDGTRPGIFYVPIRDVNRYNLHQDEDLFLHEAIPGHHFQISLQQENTALPSFRKNLWYSAYGEGWALYTESLGKELGLYEDPYQYFGMLAAEMHRAIRLVVDTGLHAKGWTREQAIQYSLENESESEDTITSEIERYMANPAQALSYKIGQLKIRELRARAEAALGEAFDIREFHRVILESGSMPLALLENKVNVWINAQA